MGETASAGFEAWESGPVHPGVWLTFARWEHPVWPDGAPVLVGDTLADHDAGAVWVVLDVRLEQRGVAETPSVRLGNPLEGPAPDDLVLYGEAPVGTGDPFVVDVPDGLERSARFASHTNGVPNT